MTLPALSALWTSAAPEVANHLWQSTLFAAVAGLLALALRKNQARARYWIWMAASLKFLIPFTLLMTIGSYLATSRTTAPAQTAVYSAIEDLGQPFAEPEVRVVYQAAPSTVPSASAHLVPLLLIAVWVGGVNVVFLVWVTSWIRVSRVMRNAGPLEDGREHEALHRLEAIGGVSKRIKLLLSRNWMEPGIFGIFRPVLIWPEGISQHLDDRHIEAILAHELCHVRRRDNLTAAIHMVVEAVFWFHPLVWWLGRRLEEERERACDEEVTLLCGRPHVYAESILKVCKFCSESPLACISGITGADLKKRVMQIMTNGLVHKLDFGRKLLLLAVGLLAVSVPIMLGQAKATQRMAFAALHSAPAPIRAVAHAIAEAATPQLAETAVTKPDTQDAAGSDSTGLAFDVATIRPSSPSPIMMRWQPTTDGLIADTLTLKGLITYAYGILPEYVLGGPDWTGSQQFDINAKLSGKEADTFAKLPPRQRAEQTREMLRTLLAERFKLKVRRETKESAIYTLVVAKGGPKLTQSPPLEPDADGHMPPEGSGSTTMLDGRHIMKRTTMQGFAMQLDRDPEIARKVVDETGLKGPYDFEYKWKPSQDGSGPSLFTVLQEQLGLKLVASKGLVETLVIEAAEKPSVDGAEVPAASIKTVALVQEKSATKPDTAMSTQESAAYEPTLTFDVASIRETKPGPEMHRVGGGFTAHSSDLELENVDLFGLLSIAYGVDYHQISGQPDWAGRTTFNVHAKSDAAADQKMATLDKEQEKLEQQHMVQTFLAERFNLKVHWATQEGNIYNLVLAKGESKLRPAGSVPPPPEELKWLGDSKTPPPIHQQGDGRLGYEFYGHNCPIEDLAHMIGSMMNRDVVNKTGLTGKFDFHIQYHGNTPRDNRNEDPTVWPPLTDALEDQLGLKLEPAKGQVRLLVVDHVDKPSEN